MSKIYEHTVSVRFVVKSITVDFERVRPYSILNALDARRITLCDDFDREAFELYSTDPVERRVSKRRDGPPRRGRYFGRRDALKGAA